MPIVNQNNITLTTADTDFINLVNNRITMYGQIPYTVPQRLIIDIIKESARLFFRMDYRSSSRVFLLLTKESILDFTKNNPIEGYEIMRGFGIVLPQYVQVVKEMYKTNEKNIISADEITEISMGLVRTSPYGSSLAGINSQLYNIAATAKMVELTSYNSILGRSISFNYSPQSQILFINEAKPTENFILECLINIHIQQLYTYDLYIRHVIGRVKQELKRMIASHVIQLPGDVTLNADEICNNLEDVERVEDILKAGSGIGDMIMFR